MNDFMESRSRQTVLLVLVLLGGIFLRWHGIDWALPHLFHPDEARLLYAVNEISRANLNPRFFAYGSLPIYLLKITTEAANFITQWGHWPPVNFFFVGRAISAFFGSLTLLILYRFGARYFTRRVALLATAFLAFTVLHIQLSHFLTVDVMLTCFVLLSVSALADLVERDRPGRAYLLAGVMIGLALATKISALPLYGVFLSAHGLKLLCARSGFRRGTTWRLWGYLLAAILLSGVVFLICEPYAWLDDQEFIRQIREQNDMVRGVMQPPYVIQYVDTPRYLYPLQHLMQYGMGLPLGVLTLLGAVWMFGATVLRLVTRPLAWLRRAESANWRTLIVIAAWVIPVGLIVGGFQVKFLRYMLPLTPFLCLLGAVWLDHLRTSRPTWRRAVNWLTGLILLYTCVSAGAFTAIYHRADPRVQASAWMYANVPQDSLVLTETWEFTSIVPLDQYPHDYFRFDQLDMYRPDSPEKIHRLAEQLAQADAVVLTTKRMYGSILRVPERYPLTVMYYKLLFDGALGFRPVTPFTTYPTLFGLTFADDFADESFSVYDHPKTIVFKKTRSLSAAEITRLIVTSPPLHETEALLTRLIAFPAQESAVTPLLTRFVAPDERESGWLILSARDFRAMLLWFGAVELLALIALPFTMLVFQRFPDHGYACAKIIGLLAPSYVVWLLVSVGLARFTPATMLAVVASAAMLAALTGWTWRADFRLSAQRAWRIWLTYEIVFGLAFLGFALFRAYNPDIFWSESSMDFSILNALFRTDTLPPPDPWISGHPLNYYYVGHYLVATLSKLTGLAPQYTYNFAFALFPALAFLLVFQLLHTLTQQFRWGLVGASFATLLGNLDGWLLQRDIWRGKEGYYRFFRTAHEVIPHTVHEFPLWTFIFVDLHAHLLNMPFFLATLSVGLHLLLDAELTPARPPYFVTSQAARRLARGLLTFFTMLLVGTLAVISSWDYPTSVIFLLLIALANACRRRWQWGQTWRVALTQIAWLLGVIVPGSFLLYAPFYAGFSRSGMGPGLVGKLTTALPNFLTMFGFFWAVIAVYLVLQAAKLRRGAWPWRILTGLLIAAFALYFAFLQFMDLNYATFLFVVTMIAFGMAIFLAELSAAARNFRNYPVAKMYVWLCLLYAGMITAGCEIIFVRDFLQGGEWKRMNTIFKFYLPAWFLLAIVAAYALTVILPTLRRTISERYRAGLSLKFLALTGAVGLGLLFLAAAVFPVRAIYARRHQQDLYPRNYLAPTFDGLAYIQAERPDEYTALRWLNANVVGTPVILEAPGKDYRYEYSRISSNTGLPTILGWKSHVEQREHWDRTNQRLNDVNEMFISADLPRVLQLLRYYHTAYIYLGETEHNDFTPAQLQKFAAHPEYFSPVFESGETVIYQVQYP